MLARGKSVPTSEESIIFCLSTASIPSPRQQAFFTSSQEIIFQRSADVPGSSELPSLAAFPFELEAMPAAVRLGMLSRQVIDCRGGDRKTVQDEGTSGCGFFRLNSSVRCGSACFRVAAV